MSFSDHDLDNFAEFAAQLADASRRETLSRFRKGVAVVNKAGENFDPVTEGDKEG